MANHTCRSVYYSHYRNSWSPIAVHGNDKRWQTVRQSSAGAALLDKDKDPSPSSARRPRFGQLGATWTQTLEYVRWGVVNDLRILLKCHFACLLPRICHARIRARALLHVCEVIRGAVAKLHHSPASVRALDISRHKQRIAFSCVPLSAHAHAHATWTALSLTTAPRTKFDQVACGKWPAPAIVRSKTPCSTERCCI